MGVKKPVNAARGVWCAGLGYMISGIPRLGLVVTEKWCGKRSELFSDVLEFGINNLLLDDCAGGGRLLDGGAA